jgi:hypothetical protein
MSIGQPERAAHNRVVALFRDELIYCFMKRTTPAGLTRRQGSCATQSGTALGASGAMQKP